MRQQPWGQRATLVAVTGWGQQRDRERTAEAGFDAHMVKPLTDLDLLQVFDEPQDVVDAIFAFYAKRGFAPSPAEREVLLNL